MNTNQQSHIAKFQSTFENIVNFNIETYFDFIYAYFQKRNKDIDLLFNSKVILTIRILAQSNSCAKIRFSTKATDFDELGLPKLLDENAVDKSNPQDTGFLIDFSSVREEFYFEDKLQRIFEMFDKGEIIFKSTSEKNTKDIVKKQFNELNDKLKNRKGQFIHFCIKNLDAAKVTDYFDSITTSLYKPLFDSLLNAEYIIFQDYSERLGKIRIKFLTTKKKEEQYFSQFIIPQSFYRIFNTLILIEDMCERLRSVLYKKEAKYVKNASFKINDVQLSRIDLEFKSTLSDKLSEVAIMLCNITYIDHFYKVKESTVNLLCKCVHYVSGILDDANQDVNFIQNELKLIQIKAMVLLSKIYYIEKNNNYLINDKYHFSRALEIKKCILNEENLKALKEENYNTPQNSDRKLSQKVYYFYT